MTRPASELTREATKSIVDRENGLGTTESWCPSVGRVDPKIVKIVPVLYSASFDGGQTQATGTFSVYSSFGLKFIFTLNLTETMTCSGTWFDSDSWSCRVRLEIRLGYFSLILYQSMLYKCWLTLVTWGYRIIRFTLRRRYPWQHSFMIANELFSSSFFLPPVFFSSYLFFLIPQPRALSRFTSAA